MKYRSEKRNEYMIVTQIRMAILKKKVRKQANINAPEPAVVIAPAKTVEPMFSIAKAARSVRVLRPWWSASV
eukprot:1630581-Heterocapsa_arctica.AAC.1